MATPASDRQGFGDDEALAWLRGRDGKLETSLAELARNWGWNRTKVTRRLQRWADEGLIARATGAGGKSVITLLGPKDVPAEMRVPSAPPVAIAATQVTETKESALPVPAPEAPAPAVPVNAPMATEFSRFVAEPIRHRRGVFRPVGALILAAVAVAIAWFGLNINAWYGATLGRTPEASALLSGLSVAADVLALILPAAACALWQDRRRWQAFVAWSLWSLTIAIALLATVGFAALNIADTTTARDRVATESAGLAARIERLRAERAGAAEVRSIATLEAEIQRAQPAAAAVWRGTSGCTDVTRAQSGEACTEVLKLRQALGTARRRDTLDAELHEAEARLAHLPAVGTADPQAEAAAKLLNWVTGSMAGARPSDIHMARVFGMTMLPQISGLVFMLAIALWQPRRRREDTA